MAALSAKQESAYQRGQANPNSMAVEGQENSGQPELAGALPVGYNVVDNSKGTMSLGIEPDEEPIAPITPTPDEPDEPDAAIAPDEPEQDEPNHNRDVVLKHMLSTGATLGEFKEEYPMEYSMVTDEQSKNPDDVFIHRLAEVNRKVYSKNPKKAESETRRQLEEMGYSLSALDKRSSTYNRFSNGAALTITQAIGGFNRLVDFVGGENRMFKKELWGEMEKSLSSMTIDDSKLYESLKPTMTKQPHGKEGEIKGNNPNFDYSTRGSNDMATPIGKTVPMVGASIAGGAVVGAETIGQVMAAETMADIMVTSAVAASDTSDMDATDVALAALAGALGYKLTPKGSIRVGEASKEIKELLTGGLITSKDIKKLLEGLPKSSKGKTRVDLPTRTKELIEDLAKYAEQGDTIQEALDKLMRSFRDARSKGINKTFLDTKHSMTSGQVDLNDIHFGNDASKALHKAPKHQEAKARTTLLLNIANNSSTPNEFLDKIIGYEDKWLTIDPKVVKWAKLMKKEGKSEAIMRYGLNGLLSLVHLPASVGTTMLTEPAVINYFNRIRKQGFTKATKTEMDRFKNLAKDKFTGF